MVPSGSTDSAPVDFRRFHHEAEHCRKAVSASLFCLRPRCLLPVFLRNLNKGALFMKPSGRLIHILFAAQASVCLYSSFAVAAPFGKSFTYQGQLKDNGVPANGTYDFYFNLYEDPIQN